MCRSTSDGGRRCTGSSTARTRALGTARKAVERARHAVDQARNIGNPETLTAAEAQLTAAEQRLNDTRAAHPHTSAAGQPRGHDTAEETAMPDDTTDTGPDDHNHHDGPQTTSHTTADGTTFTNVNYAAPGAVVGMQAHTVNGATVVMGGGGPIPPGLPDQLRQMHEQVQTAMASGHYTVHHSDDITEPSGPTGSGERVAFQVGYVHRRTNPTA